MPQKLPMYGGPHHGLFATVEPVLQVGERVAISSMPVPACAETHRERRTNPGSDFHSGRTIAVYERRLASVTGENYLGFVESLREPRVEFTVTTKLVW